MPQTPFRQDPMKPSRRGLKDGGVVSKGSVSMTPLSLETALSSFLHLNPFAPGTNKLTKYQRATSCEGFSVAVHPCWILTSN